MCFEDTEEGADFLLNILNIPDSLEQLCFIVGFSIGAIP